MLEPLSNLWEGTKELYLKPEEPPLTSASNLTIMPVAKGTFMQLTYTWSYEGRSHEGFLILNTRNEVATGAWGDSFHQSGSVMHLEGSVDKKGMINVLGSYPAPPGPDWGWRIVVDASDRAVLLITMYNIWPEGQEDIAVFVRYAPVS